MNREMNPEDTDEPGISPQRVSRWIVRPAFVLGVSGLLAASAIAWLLWLAFRNEPVRAPWMFQVLIALICLGTTVGSILQHHLYWAYPRDQLRNLLKDIHQRTRPIEELSRTSHGMRPLISVLDEILRDLRGQRADVARLEQEMRHRLSQRTNALEQQLRSSQHQAERDGLTGLNNRRMLDRQLPIIVQQCIDTGTPLSLLMIDLDHFKNVNDTLGHSSGDNLLANIGQLIRSSLRNNDLAFRYGGDEFVILQPGHHREEALQMASHLTRLMDDLGATLKIDPQPRFSIGLSSLTDFNGPVTGTEMLAHADKALYKKKTARKTKRVA